MYRPAHFREERRDVLHGFIERHPLGALVTVAAGRPEVDHVPMQLDREAGPCGRLSGHVARANPVVRAPPDGSQVLVVFAGADAYVSPSAYPSKQVDGRVVPTWNYAVVHARGPIRWFDDRDRLHALVAALTDRHESGRAEPWAVTDAPADYMDAMVRGIVGFEIEVEVLEGNFKSSQNRADADRDGVRRQLSDVRTPDELAELVRAPSGGDR